MKDKIESRAAADVVLENMNRAFDERHNRLNDLRPIVQATADGLNAAVLAYVQAIAEAGQIAKELHAIAADMDEEGQPATKAFGVKVMAIQAEELDAARVAAVALTSVVVEALMPLTRLEERAAKALTEEIDA